MTGTESQAERAERSGQAEKAAEAEALRLQAQRRYGVLDTPPEDAFDRITRLVAKLLKCPVALVTLVDEHRLWFKSRHGFTPQELPRAGSFCDEAVRGGDILIVPDARLDPRFTAHPLVAGPPGIRFYAGTPLRMAEGHALGTLCAIDLAPRQLAEAERQALHDLAAVVVDALELRLASETRRRLAEGKFDTLFEYSPDANLLVDAQGHVTRANRQAETLFGYSRAELIGMPVERLVPAAERERHAAHRSAYMAGADMERHIAAKRGVLRALARGGAEIPVEISLSRLRIEDGSEQVLAALRDVSARLAAEEGRMALERQLRQSQKMEAIGRLAGGVAHDFNNMLQIISGYTQLARDARGDAERVDAHLEQVNQAAARAAQLTRQLLAFGRRQPLERSTFSPGQMVENLARMVARLIGGHIELDVRAGPRDLKVDGDAGMLEQVLVNLCANARDAMPQGGKLSLEVRAVEAGEALLARHDWARPGPYALIEVRDTGAGLTAEARQHLFEPFFTTKPAGHGTGLGLPMAYGIVEQHRGGIEVDSDPGQGTAIRLYLPAIEAAARPVDGTGQGAALAPASPPGGPEVVLVA